MSELSMLKSSTVARDFLVMSRIQPARIHWGFAGPGGRHCGGSSCLPCREGMNSEERFVLRLLEVGGSEYLFEARPRLQAVIREVARLQLDGQSAVLRIRKDGQFVNSPISAEIIRAVNCPNLYSVSRLIERFYQPAIRVVEREVITMDNLPAPLVRIQDTSDSRISASERPRGRRVMPWERE